MIKHLQMNQFSKLIDMALNKQTKSSFGSVKNINHFRAYKCY